MNLDRSLIKQQARTIIKNKVMKLFLTAFIVSICFSIFTSVSMTVENIYSDNSYGDPFDYSYGDYDYNFGSDDGSNDSEGASDFGYFDDFTTGNGTQSEYGNDLHIYPAEITALKTHTADAAKNIALNFTSGVSTIITILLMPLTVALAFFFVEFIRGKEYEFGAGLKSVFSNAFTVNYGKKLGVAFLRTALIYVLCIFFFIPGIIFNYSSYFAFELMCDYPELSPWQAIKLSKKMIQGNRSELFVLDLSFIPWFILCVFIFPIIYVMPYYMTVKALYYENFKIRAVTTGKLTEDDFLSEQQKYAKYTAQFTNQNGAQNAYTQQNTYAQQNANAQQNSTGNNYNQPNGAYTQQYSNPNPAGYTGAYQNPAGYTGGVNMNNAYGAPVYYNPPANNTEQSGARDIYANMSESTVSNSGEAVNADNAQTEPDFTVTEPQEPVFTEPQEPAEDFVEPTEPAEPDDLTDNAPSAEPTETQQTNEQEETAPAEETVFTQPLTEQADETQEQQTETQETNSDKENQ